MLKLCRTLHNWLGIVLVVQIFLWFLSGLVMAIMPIEQVRGEHLRQLPAADWSLASRSPQQVLQNHSPAAQLRLSQRLEEETGLTAMPVYLVDDAGKQLRYSAIDGRVLPPLSQEAIVWAAQQQYLGHGELSKAQQLEVPPAEVRHLPAPLWQVNFADADNTVFYLDPATGSVLRVRTDDWRLFDFFWMLHIMDYQDRSNFNNPLLIGTAGLALLFTLTGIMLLWQRYRPRRRAVNARPAAQSPTSNQYP